MDADSCRVGCIAVSGWALRHNVRTIGPCRVRGHVTVFSALGAILCECAWAINGLASTPNARPLPPEPDNYASTVQSLTPQARDEIRGFVGEVSLPNVRELTVEDAQALATVRGPLWLSVSSLSAAAAQALSTHKGVLGLAGLETLADETAVALGDHRGSVLLQNCRTVSTKSLQCLLQGNRQRLAIGLKSITAAQARLLAAYGGTLGLQTLSHLEDDAAKELIGYHGILELSLTRITADTARTLGRAKRRWVLGLGHRDNPLLLNAEIAAEISQHNGPLRMWHVQCEPSEEAVMAKLSTYKGQLIVAAHAGLSRGVAKALASAEGSLELQLFDTPSDDALECLAEHYGDLTIGGLKACDVKAANVLAEHNGGKLRLCGVSHLSEAAATALSSHMAPLECDGFSHSFRPTAEVVVALCAGRGSLQMPASWVRPDTIDAVCLHTGGVTLIASSSCKFYWNSDGSVGSTSFTYDWMPLECFRQLSHLRAPLHLRGELTDEMFQALEVQSGDLALDRIPQSDSAAHSLLTRAGRLFLTHESHAGTEAAARVFASDKNQTSICTSQHLIGPNASEIASILGQRKGELSLPRLQYIKSDALRILAKKEDVRLPPLESIYVLAEDSRDVDPKEMVSERFLKFNSENQPPPEMPEWHSWDRLLESHPRRD